MYTSQERPYRQAILIIGKDGLSEDQALEKIGKEMLDKLKSNEVIYTENGVYKIFYKHRNYYFCEPSKLSKRITILQNLIISECGLDRYKNLKKERRREKLKATRKATRRFFKWRFI